MKHRRRHPDVHDAEHARFVEDVRASVSSPPGEETARRHLAAMRAAAQEHSHTAGAARARPALRLGAVAAGAVVAFSGTSSVLAAAGVDLPDPVRAPFDLVGIDLPNQSDDGGERVAPRDGDTPPPASAPARSGKPGDDAGDDSTQRGRSGDRRGGQGSRRDGAKDRGRSGDAPGRSRSERGRSGSPEDGNAGSGGPAGRNGTPGQPRGGSNRPATPAPPKSAGRGAGPRRPVKPRAQPRPRRNIPPKAQKRAPTPTPLPAPQPESAPTPAPETTTTTTP